MGVHARQGFNIQPLPATGHLGRVDITFLISTLLKSNVIVFDTASSEQAESRTSLLDYAEAQPILATGWISRRYPEVFIEELTRGVIPYSRCKVTTSKRPSQYPINQHSYK